MLPAPLMRPLVQDVLSYANFLDLSPEETEKTLCRLVVGGTVWARVDRPAGIVNFRAKRTAEEVMNDWTRLGEVDYGRAVVVVDSRLDNHLC